jgi:GDP/UDP-N,N'-diacetylbacillosamine 2-epimerase (hydrolysing)
MRKVAYLTGTRADFGLMQATLRAIDSHPDLDLSVIVTGTHLLPEFGNTAVDVESAGFRIAAAIPISIEDDSAGTMARNIGRLLIAICDALETERPDILLLLGDRGEMLAGAIAAAHLGIAVMHVHGGERSGTIDESVRHAISKLAHFHAVATEGSRERLVKMGEEPSRIMVAGAPGLDGLTDLAGETRDDILVRHGLSAPFALMIFHPVLQEGASAEPDAGMILDALEAEGLGTLVLEPNSDAGSAGVRRALNTRRGRANVAIVSHLPRARFVSAMATADVMIGNSSAGIIEAATFGTPVVNVGSRQRLRERNRNVIDTEATFEGLREAIRTALGQRRFPAGNLYGDGRSAQRISSWLASVTLDTALMSKVNSY